MKANLILEGTIPELGEALVKLFDDTGAPIIIEIGKNYYVTDTAPAEVPAAPLKVVADDEPVTNEYEGIITITRVGESVMVAVKPFGEEEKPTDTQAGSLAGNEQSGQGNSYSTPGYEVSESTTENNKPGAGTDAESGSNNLQSSEGSGSPAISSTAADTQAKPGALPGDNKEADNVVKPPAFTA